MENILSNFFNDTEGDSSIQLCMLQVTDAIIKEFINDKEGDRIIQICEETSVEELLKEFAEEQDGNYNMPTEEQHTTESNLFSDVEEDEIFLQCAQNFDSDNTNTDKVPRTTPSSTPKTFWDDDIILNIQADEGNETIFYNDDVEMDTYF